MTRVFIIGLFLWGGGLGVLAANKMLASGVHETNACIHAGDTCTLQEQP